MFSVAMGGKPQRVKLSQLSIAVESELRMRPAGDTIIAHHNHKSTDEMSREERGRECTLYWFTAEKRGANVCRAIQYEACVVCLTES